MTDSPTLAPTLALVIALCAGAALAHSGVANPAVKARMDLMGQIKEATAGLGKMAQGAVAFDAVAAAKLAQALANHAAEIPAAFEAEETDPTSEARPEIWSDWAGFVADAETLGSAARAMQTASREDVQFGMRAVAKACSSCHENFRIDK
jgi:cytochrome c556